MTHFHICGRCRVILQPDTDEMDFVKALLTQFGEASGLRTNLNKSTVHSIRCTDIQVQRLQECMECNVTSFSTKYLGLPLSLSRLRATNLQPILDKLADRLPGWKAALLDKSGRLILTRVVLTAIPLHILIALDVPKWMIKAIDKIWRNFF